MQKTEGALRTIGEASTELGIKPHILRYWEEQFPTLSPLKRAGGRRYYRPEDMELLRRIDSMVNDQGFTIAGARKALARGDGSIDAPPRDLVAAIEPLPAEIAARLLDVRKRLEKAVALIER